MFSLMIKICVCISIEFDMNLILKTPKDLVQNFPHKYRYDILVIFYMYTRIYTQINIPVHKNVQISLT